MFNNVTGQLLNLFVCSWNIFSM